MNLDSVINMIFYVRTENEHIEELSHMLRE